MSAWSVVIRTCCLAMTSPRRAVEAVRTAPAPFVGLAAVLVRFLGSSLTLGVLAVYLKRRPFAEPYLTLIPRESYYASQVYWPPLFGLAIWLLMSAVAHLGIRFMHHASDFDQVLNVVGLGMLTPALIMWPWDLGMMLFDRFTAVPMALSHTAFQLTEATVQTLGFRRIIGLGWGRSGALSLGINTLYILLAIVFVR